MTTLDDLFARNRAWADGRRATDPAFFERLYGIQRPEFLWIGCSDSRVPANEIIGMAPGELFVHRNVANLVAGGDTNCMAVVQYAVEVLNVRQLIVCGHYGCGGVRAALQGESLGLIDNWLCHVKDVARAAEATLSGLQGDARVDALCERNVIAQVANVCDTTIVRDAWRRGQPLTVHGWIYRLEDGLLRDLDVCVTGADQVGRVRNRV